MRAHYPRPGTEIHDLRHTFPSMTGEIPSFGASFNIGRSQISLYNSSLFQDSILNFAPPRSNDQLKRHLIGNWSSIIFRGCIAMNEIELEPSALPIWPPERSIVQIVEEIFDSRATG